MVKTFCFSNGFGKNEQLQKLSNDFKQLQTNPNLLERKHSLSNSF
jgi:hypothetical protein